MTPLQAIRKKCLDCSCENAKEVRLCPVKDCPLYEFRLGKNPNYSEQYREEARKRMKNRLSL